jgi:hypothetical protein
VELADSAPLKPVPLVDAVLEWVYDQAGRFRPAEARPAPEMHLHATDGALALAALAPLGVWAALG